MAITLATKLWRATALCIHVGNILALLSKKQVGRIGATTVVAFVTNAQSFRDCAFVQFVTKAVGSLGDATDSDLPISIWVLRCSPVPTARSLIDFDLCE